VDIGNVSWRNNLVSLLFYFFIYFFLAAKNFRYKIFFQDARKKYFAERKKMFSLYQENIIGNTNHFCGKSCALIVGLSKFDFPPV